MSSSIAENERLRNGAREIAHTWRLRAVALSQAALDLQWQRLPAFEWASLRRWADPAQTAMAALITVCALTVWNASLRTVDIRGMTDLGLVSALPTGCFIALGGLSLIFCLALFGSRDRAHPLALTLYLLTLIYMLYATPAIVEQAPRFQVTYWLAGHTEYILRNGSANPFLDAYFNWPGFFVLTGLLTSVIGAPSVLTLTAWASFVYNLLYLAPMYLIYTTATRDRRLVWLGLWFFYITDWVWQDYFSPQGLNLFLYLVIMAILLKWFKTAQATPRYVTVWTRGRTRLIAVQTQPLQVQPPTRGSAFRRLWAQAEALVTTYLKTALARIQAGLAFVSSGFRGALARTQVEARMLASLGFKGALTHIRAEARTLIALAVHPKERFQRIAPQIQRLGVRVREWLTLSDVPLAPEQRRQRIALLVAVFAVFGLSVTSHPITPFFVLLSVSALVIFRQITPRWLPILMALMIIGWDFTVASPYMAGHLSHDLETFGNLTFAAKANVSDHLSVGSADHQFVAQIRIVATGAIWGIAFLGAALRWRQSARWYAGDSSWGVGSLFTHDLKYVMLVAMPIVMIVAQPYGGEMAMRSYLFSLPVISFFAAAAFCTPIVGTPSRLYTVASVAVTIATCLLLLTGFMFARYGNERADYITYDESNAVAYLYSVAPPKSLLLQAWTGTPWRYQGLEQYHYSAMYPDASALDEHNIDGAINDASSGRYPATYVIITRGQEAQAEMFDSVRPSTFTSLEDALLASGKFVLVYRNSNAEVLMYVHSQHAGAVANRPFSTTPIYRRYSR